MLASEGYIAKKRAIEIKEIKEFLIVPLSHRPNKKNRVGSNFQPYYRYRYAT